MSEWTTQVLESLGYLGLWLVLVVENLFPPIPSELVLPLAGFFVGRGQMNLGFAVLAATAGSYTGALVLYALGRWGGRPLVLRYGHILRIDEALLGRAERWFGSWGDWVVLGARVVPIARSVVSVPAGTMRMPLLRFSVLTVIGSSIWNLVLIGAGVLLGRNWERVSHWVETYSNVVLVLLVLAVIVGGAYGLYRFRMKPGDSRR
ncbi:DedA family protein [Sphaerobacter sp.]|uniref:DedA family protein n=1 Tax=Sphaerobacter sp. TaxID=2099654 RepID=UPI001D556318|nr:DedA family protein [Sphaerobacter sp.]MBX5444206.1 DedA family protein [Sphaerobacter sp.]